VRERLERYQSILSRHLEDEVLVERLAMYAALLDRWSSRLNLVSFSSPEELVTRHLLDAVAGRHLVTGAPGRLLDIGSGAGLPGVPLVLASESWSGVFMEPRYKRAVFLGTVIRELGLNAEVARCRFDDYQGATVDLVTARALGGYEALLGWAKPRLSRPGRVALWVTDSVAAGLRNVSGWSVVSSPLPGFDRGRLLELEPCFT